MKSPALKNELILAILRTLSNLMYYNDVNRSIFYQFEGRYKFYRCFWGSIVSTILNNNSKYFKEWLKVFLLMFFWKGGMYCFISKGVEIVTKCCMLYGRSHAVYKAATKCIKMFICKALERNGKSDTPLPTKKSSPVKTRGSQVMQDTPL